MSRKKRLLLISLLILILVCFLLTIFVFMAVKETKINFSTETDLNTEEIISTLKVENAIPYGTSTLFVSRSKILAKVEEIIPKIKVNNIEIEFPNIVKINCEEREELFYFESAGQAYVLDADLKIISNQSISNAEANNFIKLNIQNELKTNENNWRLGTKIDFKFKAETLMILQKLLMYYKAENLPAKIMCNHFSEIQITQKYDLANAVHLPKLILKTEGREFIFENPAYNTNERLGNLIAVLGDSQLAKEEIVI